MTTDSSSSIGSPRPIGVLFVCMGNICRSPLAKWIFQQMVLERGLQNSFVIDSCGTYGGHAGGPADPRTRAVALKNGIDVEHTARQLDPSTDFEAFDWLLAMDLQNVQIMLRVGAPPSRVRLLRSFDPRLANTPDTERQVPDPYYGGENGFDQNFEMLTHACEGLLDELSPRE